MSKCNFIPPYGIETQISTDEFEPSLRSTAAKKRWETPGYREKFTAARKKMWQKNYTRLAEISKENLSKNRRGKNNPMFGRRHTEETKRKISEVHKGRVVNSTREQKERAKEGLRKFFSDPERPANFRKVVSDRMRKMKRPPASLALRKKRSLLATARNLNPTDRFGKVFPHSVRYRNTILRSSWEKRFAQFCDSNKLCWEYEKYRFPYSFEGRQTYYIPDFYLPGLNLFIEVKPSALVDKKVYAKIKAVKSSGNRIALLTEKSWRVLTSKLRSGSYA